MAKDKAAKPNKTIKKKAHTVAAEAAPLTAAEQEKVERDTAEHAQLVEANASKGAIKKATCFAYNKGKCKKGVACRFLHVGVAGAARVKRIAAAAANEKAGLKKERKDKKRKQDGDAAQGDTAAVKKKGKKEKDWKCPNCGNKNWGRRSKCNGRYCEGVRDDVDPDEVPSHGLKKIAASKKVFLRNLSYEIDEPNVIAFFREVGAVVDVKFLKDQKSGKINAGFAEFADEQGARKAIALSGRKCLGRPIKVVYALPPKDSDTPLRDLQKKKQLREAQAQAGPITTEPKSQKLASESEEEEEEDEMAGMEVVQEDEEEGESEDDSDS